MLKANEDNDEILDASSAYIGDFCDIVGLLWILF
jgi:hypothetical protein